MMDKTQILKVMDESQAVYLATVSEKGPSVRALANLRHAGVYPGIAETARCDGFTVYLSTSRKTRKVKEIAADPRISLYYCVPARFEGVTLNGKAVVIDDEVLRRALWCDDWRIYWPTGLDDTDYCIIRCVPETIFGWHGSSPFNFDPVLK